MNKKLVGGIVRFAAQLAAFIALIVFFAREDFSFAGNLFFVIGCVSLMIPVTLIGRTVLDANPARIAEITTTVQALRISLFGMAITRAIKTADAWTMGLVLPVPQTIGFAILAITGAALFFTFLNLAVGGLGAPAFSESVKLTKDWLYSKMRNPMVLAVFLWFVSWGLYLQSGTFVLWVLILVIPVECFFEKYYEERELEIRFGESYLRYKAITPFMFPRVSLPRLSGKMAPATGKSLLVVAILVSILMVADSARAVNWVEIPFSNGGSYIDADNVYEHNGILSLWFLAREVVNPSEYQKEVTSAKDSWTYKGKRFAISIRKVEVNMEHSPRLTSSAFAIYYDVDGKQIAEPEIGTPNWNPEIGPRLWSGLVSARFAKKQKDPGIIPEIPADVIGK